MGTASFNRAQVPATCGAAIDVPLSDVYPPPGTDDVIDSPGAYSERNGATFEYQDTTSVLLVEPTLMAEEIHAGVEIDELDPEVDLEICRGRVVETPVNYLMKNSFGFGGINCVSILKKFDKSDLQEGEQ